MPTEQVPAVRLERATAEHVRQVAGLRWDWAMLTSGRDSATTKRGFVQTFEQWWSEHAHSHLCVVGLQGGEVVAFGFLALTPRVPGPHVPSRRSADVQAVFVVPRLRNAGVGGRLIGRLVSLAREAGAEHVTVHSSADAVTAYERACLQPGTRRKRTGSLTSAGCGMKT